MAAAFIGWFVETTQGVRVKEHFEKCVYVAALQLELLRHRDTNDFAAIQIDELETVSSGSEYRKQQETRLDSFSGGV